MSELPKISKITLPGGGTYELKDAAAREAIAALQGGSYFLGVSTTALVDQAQTNPISISGKEGTVKAVNGNMAIYGNKEFVWSGYPYKQDDPLTGEGVVLGKWVEFGDLSLLGNLAYHDVVDLKATVTSASTKVLGTGSTFKVPAHTASFSGTETGNFVTGASAAATASNVSFSGTSTGSFVEAVSASAAASEVSFQSNAGSDFVTGYNNDAVAPSFSEGAFDAGSLPSFIEGAFTPASIKNGFVQSSGSAASYSHTGFSGGSLTAATFSAGSLPSYSHTGFSGGSLGTASKSQFAIEGIVASMGTGDDSETLILTTASKSNAVTEQGVFTSATYGTDSFDAGSLPSYTDNEFTAAVYGTDSFDGGSPTVIDVTKFDGGTKVADTWSAGTLPSKSADTFNAGSVATLAKAKALTASDKGSAAGQTITVGVDTSSAVTGLGTATAAAQNITVTVNTASAVTAVGTASVDEANVTVSASEVDALTSASVGISYNS